MSGNLPGKAIVKSHDDGSFVCGTHLCMLRAWHLAGAIDLCGLGNKGKLFMPPFSYTRSLVLCLFLQLKLSLSEL